jgi:hypothetical protein
VTDQLFIAINFPKLRQTADAVEIEPQRRRHQDDVPKETWACILSSLTETSVCEPRPVRRTAARIERLKAGKRVEVLWRLQNGASVSYKGTIVVRAQIKNCENGRQETKPRAKHTTTAPSNNESHKRVSSVKPFSRRPERTFEN